MPLFIIYHCSAEDRERERDVSGGTCSKMPNDVVAGHNFSRACLAGRPLPLAPTLSRVTGVQSLHKTVRRPVALLLLTV